jgi:hypothetical protein
MKLVRSLGLVLVALVAGAAPNASPAGPAQDPPPLPGPSLASGQGTTALHRFSFHARARQPGSVNVFGRATFEPRSARAGRYLVRLTCLRIAGHRAVLGGYVSGTARASRGVLFFVEDNGRGSGVDRISRLLLRRVPPRACPDPKPLVSSGLRVRGDILVKGAQAEKSSAA